LGIRRDGKLRLTVQNRSRLTCDQSWGGADAEILHRRFPLLEHDDPTKDIGRLPEPLIKPNKSEREGYGPNVVYSRGSLLHGRQLIIPCGMSDYATTFATVPLDEVLAAMERPVPV
jgi:predicted GH43/DUF377 family glycosyl hydrolase